MNTILHVEVGGTYGGSLRALELYLQHSRNPRVRHELLLYYPTPGTERIAACVSAVRTLFPTAPAWMMQCSQGPRSKRWRHSPAIRSLGQCARLFRSSGTIRRLCRLYASGRYSLVHLNNTFPYAAAALVAARISRIPCVSHIRNPIEHDLFTKTLGSTLAAIVAVSESYAREFRAFAPRWNLVVAYDSVEAPSPDPTAATELRSELLGDGRILVGSAGRLDPQKGFDDWIAAAGLICRQRPDIRFAIAGDGPLREPLQTSIGRSGLEGYVRLCGFRKDVPNFLSALDLYVSSSLWEGLPISIAEAMLLGKRVVATNVGGVAELVRPEFGRLVPPGDPSALAAAILDTVGDPAGAGATAAGTIASARALTDPARNAAELDAIFAACLERRAAETPGGSHVRVTG